MRITMLSLADVPSALRLSTQVGWNQTEADWKRLLAVAPDGCYGGWVDGTLVATTTLVAHGSIGWIGMVLVDEDHRRRGYATQIFTHAMEAVREREISALGLDATDAGRAVYSDLGFVDAAPIVRWSGTLTPSSHSDDRQISSVTAGDADIYRYDTDACGADRRRFLDRLISEPGVRGFDVRLDGDVRGYALYRPGREHWHVGPLVADDAVTSRVLLSAIASDIAGESAIVDMFEKPEAERDAENYGLTPQRRLTRMVHREARPLLMGKKIVAAGGFEWG